MGRPKTLKLADVRLDGDTQVRCQLDEAAVADYCEAIKRGDKLPPITVFHDGSNYWLGDGFHRVPAHRAAGKREISAFVQPGTRVDAAWFALGANKANGLRMSQADKARAIKRALAARPKMSNAAIAKHIGCDDHTVAKYRTELESGSEIPNLKTRTGLDGKTYSAAKPPADDLPPVVDDEEDLPPTVDDEPAAGALQPTSKPAGRDHAKSGPAGYPMDHAGNRIPNPEIAEAFRRTEELTHMCSALSKIKSQLLALCEKHDPIVADIVPAAFSADINNARNHIASAKPFAVCPHCGGDGCKACKRRGWVNELSWNAAPSDIKASLGVKS